MLFTASGYSRRVRSNYDLVDLPTLANPPEFNWRRAVVALIAAAGIILAASWLVRTYPNDGFRAGYDAAISEGRDRVRTEVDATEGTAISLCNRLHLESQRARMEPTYDHRTFLQGCSRAVDHLYGNRVPLETPPG